MSLLYPYLFLQGRAVPSLAVLVLVDTGGSALRANGAELHHVEQAAVLLVRAAGRPELGGAAPRSRGDRAVGDPDVELVVLLGDVVERLVVDQPLRAWALYSERDFFFA